ncbi:Acetylornithine aminotransferase [uncultured spirochete]|uniref:Acetylornithine aminotransferase n=1 Tax=uncultured spirochete TaxID=156406 RepID=A0A3P3XNR5_9SPIR|nr:Acetylornithine aminotransferase [uncultured spirochete]
MKERFMNTYARTGLVLDHGAGARLFAADGTEYIDFTAGIGVNSLGHGHPKLVAAIAAQAAKLMHVSNYFMTPPSMELADRLTEATGFDTVFFCNSGAEANEGMFKLARKYGSLKNPDKNVIVTLKQSFHGRTITTVTATGQDKFHRFFGPFTPGFAYVEPEDIGALDALLGPNVCAFVFEPIQGEGGVRLISKGYLQAAEKMCRERDILFCADEVQTGIGRTGALLACERLGLRPDVTAVAKGLAGGVPVGAILARGAAADVFQPGDHGTTFGGGPLAASAALVVLSELDSPGFLDEVDKKGRHLMSLVEGLRHPLVKDVRGMGLMVGIGVVVDPHEVVDAARAHNLLVLTAGDDTVRLLPPLVITMEDIDAGAAALKLALDDVEKAHG